MAGTDNSRDDQVSIPWLILAGVCAPLGFNIVVALLPAIQAQFALDSSRMQWMVSIYAMTMALGQMVAGPLSDALGRRRVLLAGLAIFVVGSIGAALAWSYEMLLVCRLVQGLGACATVVIPRAVVRDRYFGPEAARAMALIMISFAVTPVLAPLVGGILQALSGWRAGFFACALVGAVLFVLALYLHGETLAPFQRVPMRLVGVLLAYARLLGSARFCAYAFSFSLLNCCFMGWLVVGPLYMTRQFGLTPVGLALAMLAAYLGFALGNQLAAHQVRRAGVERLLASGTALCLTGSLMLAAIAASLGLAGLLVAIFLQSFGIGLAFAAGIAGATAVYPERAGTASALAGAIQLGVGAVFVVLSGAIDDGSLMPLALSSIAVCVAAAACVWPLWRQRLPTATAARAPSGDRAGRP